MVISIPNRQLNNKIQLETWKQDENCQKIQKPRERERERESKKSTWQGKKSEQKEQKKCFEEEDDLMYHFESNINYS